MSDDLKRRIDAIEEGYEFFLAYAAQGLTDESASKAGEQVRSYLRGFEEALDGLDEAFRGRLLEGGAAGAAASAEPGDGGNPAAGTATDDAPGADPAAVDAALDVLRRDAEASRALVRLVAAQASVSSQLIDNLNASIHVRALLTDVFVLGELVGV
ncbi:MAG: hypothetical protein OXH51_07540 [Gemmatimonadetes bacterium]|nr:hypothetical protein [Gemmatimonadota bacterium]MCY3611371.1 hypothetical protein [Gemmatimonadota bacterium]